MCIGRWRWYATATETMPPIRVGEFDMLLFYLTADGEFQILKTELILNR